MVFILRHRRISNSEEEGRRICPITGTAPANEQRICKAMRPGDSSDSLVLQRKKIQSKVLSRRQRYIPISLLQMSNTRWARPFSNHLRMEIYARPYPNGEWPTFIETVNILAKSKDGMCHGITTQVVHQPVNSNAVASAYAQAHEAMNHLFHNGGEDTLLAVDLVQV